MKNCFKDWSRLALALSRKKQVKSKYSKCHGCEVITLFYANLSMEFQLLIESRVRKIKDFSCFHSVGWCLYHANKCLNANEHGISSAHKI